MPILFDVLTVAYAFSACVCVWSSKTRVLGRFKFKQKIEFARNVRAESENEENKSESNQSLVGVLLETPFFGEIVIISF